MNRIGIPKEKLFDVGDLSEDLNLEKVLDCLESVGLKCNELGEKVIYSPIPIKEEPSHLLLRSIEKKQSKRQSIIVNKSLARQSIALLNLDVVKEPVHSKSAPHIKISPRRGMIRSFKYVVLLISVKHRHPHHKIQKP